MGRRRLPKIDPCRVDLKRLRKLSADQLMNVWVRLGASAPSRTRVNSLLKGIVSNWAAAKTSASAHRDPKVKRQAIQAYVKATRVLEAEFRTLRAKSCLRR